MNEFALLDSTGKLLRTDHFDVRPDDPVGKGWRWVPVSRPDIPNYKVRSSDADGRLSGDNWVIGGDYTSLGQAKSNLKLEVTSIFHRKTSSSIDVAGTVISTSPQSVQRINRAVHRASATGKSIKTVTRAGVAVEFSAAQLTAIQDAVEAYWEACDAREHDLFKAIDAATNIAELEAIDISKGWPVNV